MSRNGGEREKDFLKGQTSTSQGTREGQSFTKTTSLSSLITSLLHGGMRLFLVGIFLGFCFQLHVAGRDLNQTAFLYPKLLHMSGHTHTQTKV